MLTRRSYGTHRKVPHRALDALEALPEPAEGAVPEALPADAPAEAIPEPPPVEAIAEIPPSPPPPPPSPVRSSARLQAVRKSSASLPAARRSSAQNPAVRRSSASIPSVKRSSSRLPRPDEDDESPAERGGKPVASSKAQDWTKDKRVLIGAGGGGLLLLILIIALSGPSKPRRPYYSGSGSGRHTRSTGPSGFLPHPKSTGLENYDAAAAAARAYKSGHSPENWQKLHLLKKNLNNAELDRLKAEFGNLTPP